MILLWFYYYGFFGAFIHSVCLRGIVCCSMYVSSWMLMKFISSNLMRKAWIFVSRIAYVNWGVVFVGGMGGPWSVNWEGRWRVTGMWYELRCSCM